MSGIGNSNKLKNLGIDVVHELKGVGENLQDHLMFRPIYKIHGIKSLNKKVNSLFGNLMIGLEYVFNRSGPMTMGASQLCMFAKSDPSLELPDLQWHVQPMSMDTLAATKNHDFHAFTPTVSNVRPSSRGHVSIVDQDSRTYAKIKQNYLSEIIKITDKKNFWEVYLKNKSIHKFRSIILTCPYPQLKKLSKNYLDKKVLNLNIELSEKIKSNLNKDIIFSENEENTKIFKNEFINIIKDKKLSFDLIKKIIFARIEETLNLSFKTIDKNKSSELKKELKIILIGQGSKILNNKYIDMKETTPLVDEIDFFEESTTSICESGLKLMQGINKQEVVIIPKKGEMKKKLKEIILTFHKEIVVLSQLEIISQNEDVSRINFFDN